MATSLSLESLLSQARVAENAGRLAEAAALLDAHADAFARSGLWNYARGTLAFRQGQVDAALARFEEAVRREPEVAEYRSNLGAALLEQARRTKAPEPLARAQEELSRALTWGPSLPSTRVNLGLCHLLGGRAEEALAQFDLALASAPRDVPALFNRAAALKHLGRTGECLAALDAILAQQPGFDLAVKARASLTAKQGKA